MLKKAVIILMFIALFALGAIAMFYMQKKATSESVEATEVTVATKEKQEAADEPVYTYKADNLSEKCAVDDKIFCAVERTVKCTINPDMSICNKNYVPNFVLGQTNDVERPKEISFKIVKIKPIPESSDISVYTQSDCDTLWFGLCKGTVVYSLTSAHDEWQVMNIFALE